MRHDPSAILAHLKPIFSMIEDSFPQIDTLHFWSGGQPHSTVINAALQSSHCYTHLASFKPPHGISLKVDMAKGPRTELADR